MKNGKYWFGLLTDEQKIEFEKEASKLHGDSYLEFIYNEAYGSFKIFLSYSLVYNRTEKGFDYWLNIEENFKSYKILDHIEPNIIWN